ncbi:hypothetical protein B0H16DRAFT_1737889 [Mycena metata]|uniref:Secreted protein n=1 Tax=Mycena metata TaxID=1033252 RepID=A0AAD7MKX7_9AGAR|nr:hypothetical protein B0H16DRAFT_1737889 [Mycena metata]
MSFARQLNNPATRNTLPVLILLTIASLKHSPQPPPCAWEDMGTVHRTVRPGESSVLSIGGSLVPTRRPHTFEPAHTTRKAHPRDERALFSSRSEVACGPAFRTFHPFVAA